MLTQGLPLLSFPSKYNSRGPQENSPVSSEEQGPKHKNKNPDDILKIVFSLSRDHQDFRVWLDLQGHQDRRYLLSPCGAEGNTGVGWAEFTHIPPLCSSSSYRHYQDASGQALPRLMHEILNPLSPTHYLKDEGPLLFYSPLRSSLWELISAGIVLAGDLQCWGRELSFWVNKAGEILRTHMMYCFTRVFHAFSVTISFQSQSPC